MNDNLLNNFNQRYAAQIILPEIGIDGQQKLQAARVLCVGLGGLAASALPYLAAAGVGTLGIMDGDQVALENLHRQLLYRDKHVGISKVIVAKEYLEELNPYLKVISYPYYLNLKNAKDSIAHYDYILDGSDNFATHLLLNDICWIMQKPLVVAAVESYYGYCMSVIPHLNSPCLRCFIGKNIPKESFSCSSTGVLGTLPGLLGVYEATHILKLILNLGLQLAGTVLWCDAFNFNFKKYNLLSDPFCSLCSHNSVKITMLDQLIRPQFSRCNAMNNEKNDDKTMISYNILQQWLKKNPNLGLIDVRNWSEHQAHNIGGICIPLDELINQLQYPNNHSQHLIHQFKLNDLIVIYCQKGLRSHNAAIALRKAGFTNIYSLKNGVQALN